MSADAIVVVAARRTPIGGFQGLLGPLSATELGAAAIGAVVGDAGIEPAEIDAVLMGCVLPAGLGQAPARQAALGAGLPVSVSCTTVNKVCGSGMMSALLGHDRILAGSARIVLAGGMESMSNAPYLLPKARAGYRMGHHEILDHMFFDGLQNPYDGNMMGHFAEATAAAYEFSREAQDEFAFESVRRARAALESGAFTGEIVAVTAKSRRGEQRIDQDEEPLRADLDKIPGMRPAFARDGTVTAATSSSIADGAAALLLMSAGEADRRGLEPLARIVRFASHSQEPQWFTTAPGPAVNKLLEDLDWSAGDVDLYEINEAFACVTMAAMHDTGADHSRVNVNGGACALGHPIGATGARIMVTLIHALRARGSRRGIATQCIGGGEAVAVAVEIA